MGRHRHTGGRYQRQEREQSLARPVAVHASVRQEQRLEVVGQSDGNDWKVGRQREHREQGQEDVQRKLKPIVRFGRLKRAEDI